LLGITNARFGRVPALISTMRSVYGRAFSWLTLAKLVHGACLRVYEPPFAVHAPEPTEGRSSEYARHVRPAASQACPRCSMGNGDPGAGQSSLVTPIVLPDHSAR